MSPIDQSMVERKLKVIIRNLKQLTGIRKTGWTTYENDLNLRKASERYLQEIIESASDINSHLLVQTGKNAPEDYYSSFVDAGQASILSRAFAKKLAPWGGFRNRIVHGYDTLSDEKVFESIGEAIEIFPIYVRAITKRLK